MRTRPARAEADKTAQYSANLGASANVAMWANRTTQAQKLLCNEWMQPTRKGKRMLEQGTGETVKSINTYRAYFVCSVCVTAFAIVVES